MYTAHETVGLELKYFAKDSLSGGLNSARGSLTKFAQFAQGIAAKVKGAFRAIWTAATGPVGMLIGGMGIAGAGYGLFSYLKGAVQVAGDWETYLAKLTVALKDATKAKQAFEWAKQFAAKTPFEMGEVVDATTRLELYGMAAQKWLPLVGDMAGAMGRSITDAVEAVADLVSGGGTERIKEFGITSNVLIKYGAKSSGPGSLSYAGDEAIERLKRALEAVISSRYGGGMSKMLETWRGKTSNLADAFSQIKGRIGEGMMPALKRVVDKTTEWLNKLLASGLPQKLGATLGKAIDAIFAKFQQGVEWVITNWPRIKEAAVREFAVVKEWATGIADKIKEWAGYGTSAKSAFKGLGDDIGKGATALGGIDESLKSIKQSTDAAAMAAVDLNNMWAMLRIGGWATVEMFWAMSEGMNILAETAEMVSNPQAYLLKRILFGKTEGQRAIETAQHQRELARAEAEKAGKDYTEGIEKVRELLNAQTTAQLTKTTPVKLEGQAKAPDNLTGGYYYPSVKGGPTSSGYRQTGYGPVTYYGPGLKPPEGSLPAAVSPIRGERPELPGTMRQKGAGEVVVRVKNPNDFANAFKQGRRAGAMQPAF